MKHWLIPSRYYEESCKEFHTFYEELQHCVHEMQKIALIVEALKLSTTCSVLLRNYQMIKLNFNYLLTFFNLFKLEEGKILSKIHKKVYLLQLFLFTIDEFKQLRSLHDNYFYFSKEEENRYLEGIKYMYNEESLHLKPSKTCFMYLRFLRFYIFKINKQLFKNNRQDKLTFYV
jgi:hypothetical protein